MVLLPSFFFLLIKSNKEKLCYLYTLTILYILYAIQDNSSSFNAAQGKPKGWEHML